MAKVVIVGCKLPNGLTIEHPMPPHKTVTLKGKNASLIIGADYGSTEVDGDFWEQWIAVNGEFPAVKSGAIFVAKSMNDVAAVAKDLAGELTGLEPMRTDGKDERAKGAKTRNDKE